jgi:aryl-alcohol dehydrogenase-like predicted oxidoreductase
MQYRTFGKTGWGVSAVGLGTWNLGNQWGEIDDETAERIVRSAFDAGVNLFDVAESYGIPNGLSEQRLGRALDGFRDQAYVVSKIGHWGKRTGQGIPKTTADMIRLCGHASAGRLGTDRVDLMLCHEGDIEDPSVYVEGFERLVEEGYVREYGISTDSIDVLEQFYEASEGNCAAVEVNYSLVNRSPEEDVLPFCREHDLGVLVRGPLSRGLLAGKYDRETEFIDPVREAWNEGGDSREEFLEKLATVERVEAALAPDDGLVETALRYVLSHPADPVVIPGATSPAQAVQNAAVGDRTMDPERRRELEDL